MDNNFSKISELEKRVNAERNELENLISIYESTENSFVKNKLQFLQKELEYLNNQCKLLNESVEESSSKAEVPVRKRAYIPAESPAAVKTEEKPSVKAEPLAEVKAEAKPAAEVKPAEAKPEVVAKPVEAAPVTATKPVEAAKPVEPTKPVESAKPVEPAKHAEPIKPVEPAKPVAASVSVSKPEPEELPDVVVAPEDTSYFERKKEEENKNTDKANVADVKTFEPRIRQWSRDEEGEAKTDAVAADNTEDVKAEAVKDEASKADAIKAETPKADAVKAEAPKADAIKAEAPKTEAAKADAIKAETPKADAVKTEAPKAEAVKAAAPKKDEFEVEETVEIKIPASVANSENKNVKNKASIENRIGLWVMPVLAATLIFISVILLASALPEYIGDILKQITMVIAGISFAGIGVILKKKKIGGAFGQVLMAIGVGELFVTLAVCRFVFNSINDLWLFILILIWSVALIVLKQFSSVLFQSIGEIGVSIAVIFG
ncbi:MAG: hypothetical protein J6X80_09375, partial [Lachnospiraceae bacterium]|nr:hypothetical protein [Lachnospiraceae bacterium]